MWDDGTETTQDNTKQSMQKEANKSLGIFFSTPPIVDYKNEHGYIELKANKRLEVHFNNKEQLTETKEAVNKIDKDLIPYSFPVHYRQPKLTIDMSCTHEKRKSVWAALANLEIPKYIQDSSYSRPTSPCTSPMSSPRLKAKA